MKIQALLCAFLLPVLASSQTVSTLNVTTNEITYSIFDDKIYASIPSANGANGNSIGVIDPSTVALTNTFPIGSEPTVLAISDDGQTLYTGFSGTSTVRKFLINTNTASIQFPIGNDFSGQFYAEDIEVMPNHPNTIAVSRKNNTSIPRHEGVAIFDEGVMRTTTTPDHTGSNQIEFADEFSLIGYNNESTEYGFRRMNVNAGGITVASVSSLPQGPGLQPKFSTYNGRAYFNTGGVVDYNFTPYVSGTFSGVRGPGVFDPNNNLVCFASSNSGGAITFARYNPETYLMVDSLPLNSSQAFGEVLSITNCGNGCYAFNTATKVVVLKNYPLNLTDYVATQQVSLHPNPAVDLIAIEKNNSTTIQSIDIFNLLGQLVKTIATNEINTFLAIDVSTLNTGTYLMEITTNEGKAMKKFVKM